MGSGSYPRFPCLFWTLVLVLTLDLEQLTDRRAPKKMGSRAMSTRLPYASAVPSGVATNLAVAFSASVPLESVAFRESRTEASGAGTGTGSVSDMAVLQGTAGAGKEQTVGLIKEAVRFSFIDQVLLRGSAGTRS